MPPKPKNLENPVVSMLRNEKSRIERTIIAFEKEIDRLPSGSLQVKKSGGREYWYRVHKNNHGKTIYSRIQPRDIPDIKREIKRRKYLESSVRSLQHGIRILERALRGEGE